MPSPATRELPEPVGQAMPSPPVEPSGAPGAAASKRWSRSRILLARFIALAADLLQIVALPAFFPGGVAPWDDVLDLTIGAVLTFLLGWHWLFLPTFVAELLPVVDILPTWTAAVWFVTRRKQGA